MGTIKIPAAEVLKKIYGETEESSARYTNLAVNFEKKYHHDKAEFFTAPGRTEIIGNHVDHNGGQIIAASIDLDTIGAAYPNGTNVIHMISEGYTLTNSAQKLIQKVPMLLSQVSWNI